MKWRCAILQRWLPGYLDGDLPGFRRRWLEAHLSRCPACRQEAAELREVMEVLQASPVKDPGLAFWQEFNQELHLKLARAAQEAAPAPRRGFQIPYYIAGAAALGALVLYISVQSPVTQQPLLKQEAKTAPAPAMKSTPPRLAESAPAPGASAPVATAQTPPAPAAEADLEKVIYAGLGDNNELESEDDLISWDLDPVIADLSEREREALLQKLRSRGKDGSCVPLSSSVVWA